jgi:glycosyl hydrolase family 16
MSTDSMQAHRVTERPRTVGIGRPGRLVALAAAATSTLALGGIALGTPPSPATPAGDATQVAAAAHGRAWTGTASRSRSGDDSWHRQAQQRTATRPPVTQPAPTSGTSTSAPAPTPVLTAPAELPDRPAPPSPSAPASATAPGTATTPAAGTPTPPAVTGSGAAAPSGDLAGWHQVFVDDFTAPTLGSQWRTYTGQPGGSPYGRWDPSHVQVGGGNLVLTQSRQDGEWVAGGLANRAVMTHGKVEMRFRVDASDEMAYAALLWPADDSWPPEIDFAEDAGGDRSGTTATLHHGAENTMVHERAAGDFTQWHTMGVEWTPGRLVYTLDGRPWATTEDPDVPDTPMNLAIQVQPGGCRGGGGAFGCGVGNPDVARMQVDWVALFAPA